MRLGATPLSSSGKVKLETGYAEICLTVTGPPDHVSSGYHADVHRLLTLFILYRRSRPSVLVRFDTFSKLVPERVTLTLFIFAVIKFEVPNEEAARLRRLFCCGT